MEGRALGQSRKSDTVFLYFAFLIMFWLFCYIYCAWLSVCNSAVNVACAAAWLPCMAHRQTKVNKH